MWLAVGLFVPLLLVALSLLFGPALRRAAAVTRRASKRAVAAIGRASRRVTGEEEAHEDARDDAGTPRVRVADDPLRHVRAVTPEQAQREAMRAAELHDEDVEDAEAWADRRATEEAERWEPPDAWREEDERAAAKRAKRRL